MYYHWIALWHQADMPDSPQTLCGMGIPRSIAKVSEVAPAQPGDAFCRKCCILGEYHADIPKDDPRPFGSDVMADAVMSAAEPDY